MNTWLHMEIKTGLLALASLNLERTPPREAQAFEVVVNAWASGLMQDRVWDAQRDIPRLRTAFSRMLTACRAWPSPREFLDYIPPAEQKQITYKPTPANPAKVQAIMNQLARELGIESRMDFEKPDVAKAEDELKRHYSDAKTRAAGGSDD